MTEIADKKELLLRAPDPITLKGKGEKQIKSALISVFNKAPFEPIIRKLHDLWVQIYSTDGTQRFIEGLGIPVTTVESVTGYPSLFDGRVKTIHPSVAGGILNMRDNVKHQAEKAEHNIPDIDLVIVDLYPFEETVASGATHEEIVEKIDIGGPNMIRAGVKNHTDVLVVAAQAQAELLLTLLEDKEGMSDLADRQLFAAHAMNVTSNYDSHVFNYMNGGWRVTPMNTKKVWQYKEMRYGENPHQKSVYYGDIDALFDELNGKGISHNNMGDIQAAAYLLTEKIFDKPSVAIMKHANSCGLASGDTICEAYKAAYACDTTSAFGWTIYCNRPIDVDTANEMNGLFFDMIIAPDFEPEALAILQSKKNRIIIRQKVATQDWAQDKVVTTMFDGELVQDRDATIENKENFTTVSALAPSETEIADLELALVAVKHLKSNAVALVKNGQLIGSGCGQTARIDALKHAIHKAQEAGFDLQGAVMASEAFFPMADCVDLANEVGVKAIVQPGGSIKDKDVIAAVNRNWQSMVTTGVRHFKHNS